MTLLGRERKEGKNGKRREENLMANIQGGTIYDWTCMKGGKRNSLFAKRKG